MKDEGVVKATADQCQYGCADDNGNPVKKPPSFMTNAPELAKDLGDRCNGRGGDCSRPEKGTHAQRRGRTARMAAMYHSKLCRAILVGFRRQLKSDGICKDGYVGMLEAGQENTEVSHLPLLHIGVGDQLLDVEVSPVRPQELKLCKTHDLGGLRRRGCSKGGAFWRLGKTAIRPKSVVFPRFWVLWQNWAFVGTLSN